MISHTRIIQWMNVIRQEKGEVQARILENFWASQLNSKMWLVDSIQKYCEVPEESSIYIFGGWYGILAQLLRDLYPKTKITSVDEDILCGVYGRELMLYNDNITFLTSDMADFISYSGDTSLVINTSTEHINQNTFNKWFENIPKKVSIILQGNNFFDCQEHIRCSPTLYDFKKMNPLENVLMSEELDCVQFKRWMQIGYKS